VLCWYPQDFQFVADNLMRNQHITAVYKLWDWSNSSEAIYALYNINPENGEISRVSPTWNVSQQVINSTPKPIDTESKSYGVEILIAVILCVFFAIYFLYIFKIKK
ncbi:MAG: hypothetical protein N3D85_07920, partial [Candidatus Bathyarchaeota archaeon]|nr:hypothetical protein [Candidatus Bathyarchaeota archaeon]